MQQIYQALPDGVEIYLVGGAVRDALMGRISHDFDFVLPKDTFKITRKLADDLGGAYFPLDEERKTARIVMNSTSIGGSQSRFKLDFATFQGSTLVEDLSARDFTVNAMAVDLRPPHICFDPLNGTADLVARRLQACSPTALSSDPVRVLRAVRQALDLNLKIMPETIQQMRKAADELQKSSPERIRDEFFNILDGKQPDTALQILGQVGVLERLLPEISRLAGIRQSLPHVYDVFAHTLDGLHQLVAVLDTLAVQFDPDKASSLMLGLLSLRLGRYRQQLHEHLDQRLNPERSMRALILLAALYHDAGKSATQQVDEQGRLHFFDHEQVSERLVFECGEYFRLSNLEIDRLRRIVLHHMRPFHLGQSQALPSKRAIYRFFRDSGPAGVDICLLSMADMLATYGVTLRHEDWAHHLDVIRCLWEAWWEHPQEQVSPARIVNGNDLMQELGLQPGPQIGQLLDAIHEAQAAGEVTDRQQALDLARSNLS